MTHRVTQYGLELPHFELDLERNRIDGRVEKKKLASSPSYSFNEWAYEVETGGKLEKIGNFDGNGLGCRNDLVSGYEKVGSSKKQSTKPNLCKLLLETFMKTDIRR